MNKVEASGRTTQEALRAAAQQLGANIDELEYEVIEEGAKGFLGLGQTPTVIRAWTRQAAQSAREPKAKEPGAGRQRAVKEPRRQIPPRPEPRPQLEPEGEPAPEPVAEPAPVAKVEAEPQPVEEVDGEAAGIAEGVVRFLSEVLRAMGVEAAAQVRSSTKEEVVIEITGKDVAILIGRHGQTLDALQYLCGIRASRESRVARRIILDAEGYRERHKELLERKALDYARAAVEAGKEAVLEPQSARDRRIIHLALADHPDVYTYSEGEGEARHVVISPKK